MQENKPILIVGLGNPGPEYTTTRHNVGFMAVDAMAGDVTWKNEKNALTARGTMGGQSVIFVKPQTYMNDSGRAVLALMTFYKLPLENLVVIHDDMDLPNGKMREKTGGGSAGHNGIKSIDAAVGNEYKRIRIGIGHPRDFESPILPADWVLGHFTAEQLTEIKKTISEIKLF